MKLREAEGALQAAQDALQAAQGRADALAAALVADHARRHGVTVDALTAAGHSPAEMIGDDGTLDTAQLARAAKETRKKFGIPPPGVVPLQGTGTRTGVGVSWRDLITDRKR